MYISTRSELITIRLLFKKRFTSKRYDQKFFSLEKWAELLPALFEASKSPSAEHREAALRIFSAVPNIITDQPINIVKQVFSGNLQDANNASVSFYCYY